MIKGNQCETGSPSSPWSLCGLTYETRDVSCFEQYIINAKRSNTTFLSQAFDRELREFICSAMNQIQRERCFTTDELQGHDVESFLQHDPDRFYELIGELNDDGLCIGSIFRLLDYTSTPELNLLLKYAKQCLADMIEGIVTCALPFFYMCRSNTFVRTISKHVVYGIFYGMMRHCCADGKLINCWEHWVEETVKGKLKAVKEYDSLISAAAFLFVWKRLQDNVLKSDDVWQLCTEASHTALELLRTYQLRDGSWPDRTTDRKGCIKTTSMAVHALVDSFDAKDTEAVQRAGAWLQDQFASHTDLIGKNAAIDAVHIDAILLSQGDFDHVSFPPMGVAHDPAQNTRKDGDGAMGNKVFIVHGHDMNAKQEMARALEKGGLQAVILQEQANRGMSIIEKIESYTDVSFAVVLYTECDIGRAKDVDPEHALPRARQNVVFEHGYLIGKLGRERVCVLIRGNVEPPSGIAEIGYIEMDNNGSWKRDLAKELEAAGLTFCFEKLVD